MTPNKKILIGIIGGSGLDDPNILTDYKTKKLATPFGQPSSLVTLGSINRHSVAILARHGPKHTIPPSSVPYQANIWALKEIGCTHIFATTACGSLKAEIKPGDLVFPDQFIDFTRLRPLTFYNNQVVHTPMATPFDSNLRQKLIQSATGLQLNHHPGGTVITIEGPRFSTKAESNMFRLLGADVINMSTVPEITLANEVGIPYQSVAMSTDYDCWKDDEPPVTFEMILDRMNNNASRVKKLLVNTISAF